MVIALALLVLISAAIYYLGRMSTRQRQDNFRFAEKSEPIVATAKSPGSRARSGASPMNLASSRSLEDFKRRLVELRGLESKMEVERRAATIGNPAIEAFNEYGREHLGMASRNQPHLRERYVTFEVDSPEAFRRVQQAEDFLFYPSVISEALRSSEVIGGTTLSALTSELFTDKSFLAHVANILQKAESLYCDPSETDFAKMPADALLTHLEEHAPAYSAQYDNTMVREIADADLRNFVTEVYRGWWIYLLSQRYRDMSMAKVAETEKRLDRLNVQLHALRLSTPVDSLERSATAEILMQESTKRPKR